MGHRSAAGGTALSATGALLAVGVQPTAPKQQAVGALPATGVHLAAGVRPAAEAQVAASVLPATSTQLHAAAQAGGAHQTAEVAAGALPAVGVLLATGMQPTIGMQQSGSVHHAMGVQPVTEARVAVGVHVETEDAIRAAAEIKEAISVAPRSSPRLVGVADNHVMERLKKRAAWKNLENGEGNPLSILSFDDSVVASKISSIGILVGDVKTTTNESILKLKLVENDGLSRRPASTTLVSQLVSDLENIEEEEDLDFENLAPGHLCGDLMEEVMDEDNDHLSCEFQIVFKKNKATNKKNRAKIIRVVRKHNKSWR